MIYLLVFLLAAFPAYAEEESASKTIVVTPIQKCYDQLGAADTADIRAHYERPYEECIRRLGEKLQKEKKAQEDKAQAAAEAAQPTASPNYYRVRKDPPAQKTEKK